MTKNKSTIRNVLMTTDTVGGVWTYCMDLIRTMARFDVHFHLVTAGGRLSESQNNEVDALENVTLHETEFRLEWMENPWNDIDFSGWQLLELEKRYKPDIIHLNSYSYAALKFEAPVLVVAHSDVFSWWYAVKKDVPDFKWQRYFQRVKKGLRNADCVVAPSDAMLNMLTSIYGKPADTRIIYNGRCANFFYQADKQPVIMCAGRFWDEAKNLTLVQRAAPGIRAMIQVAGETGDCHEHSYSENIHFLGKVDQSELAYQLAKTAVFVAPARYEPFGLSILEAALSGCALVLGDILSLRELWKGTAFFVDPDDISGLENICNKLIDNSQMAIEYGNKAKERAKSFCLEKTGLAYFSLYHELAIDKVRLKQMQTA